MEYFDEMVNSWMALVDHLCVMSHTYAPSHLALAGVVDGSVDVEAEYYMRTKYQELDSVNLFVALAIETS